jgi:uncharacterized protein (TIGR00106 family)
MQSILLEMAMFPTDKGESVSKYVSKVVKMISESGHPYKLTPMGSIIETQTMDEALHIIKSAYEILAKDANRIYTTMKFDIRKNQQHRMQSKIASIEQKIGKINQ